MGCSFIVKLFSLNEEVKGNIQFRKFISFMTLFVMLSNFVTGIIHKELLMGCANGT